MKGESISVNIDISVVIPVHNCEKQIKNTVKKLLRQKNVTFEILLVENNSTDNSWKSCKELAASTRQIKAIQTTMKGTNRARQLGVSNTSGDWVTFMDQDDSFISTRSLSSMLKLVKNSTPVPDVAQFGNFNGIHSIPLKRRKQPSTDSIIDIDFSNIGVFGSLLFWVQAPVATPTLWSKLFKGDLIRKAFTIADYPLYYCEDLYSNFVIFSHSSVKTFRSFSEAFYCWNFGGTSCQDQAGIRLMKEYCLIRPQILDYLYSVGAYDTANRLNVDTIYFFRVLLNTQGWSADLEEIWKSVLFKRTREEMAGADDQVVASFCSAASAFDFYSILKEKNLLV